MSRRLLGRELFAVWIGTLGLSLLAAGCGSSSSSSSESSGSSSEGSNSKPAKVAYLNYVIADYQKAMKEGMQSKVEPGGGSITMFTANFNQQQQQEQCEDAVQSGRYNILVVAPVTNVTGIPCVKVAEGAEIPVIAMEFAIGPKLNEVEPQLPGVVKSITTPPETVSEGSAKLAEDACKGIDPCKVITEMSTTSDPASQQLIEFVEEIPNVEIVGKVVTGYDPAKLTEELPNVLTAHPDTNVFVTLADFEALAAVPIAKNMGLSNQLKLIGNGGSREGVAGVKNGTLFGTVGSWPLEMGELAGEAAVEAANGKPIDEPGVNAEKINSPFIVTKSNVAEFTPQWGAGS